MEEERKEEELGQMSQDMQFSRPEKNKCVCVNCKFFKPDTVITRNDGSKLTIEHWDNAECEKYYDKPLNVFVGEKCEFYEKK